MCDKCWRVAVCVIYTYQAGVSHPPWSRGLWLPPRGSEASCPREVVPCAAASRREAEYPQPRPVSRCRHLNQRKSELPVNNTLGCPSTKSTGFISYHNLNGVYFSLHCRRSLFRIFDNVSFPFAAMCLYLHEQFREAFHFRCDCTRVPLFPLKKSPDFFPIFSTFSPRSKTQI